VNKLSKNKIKWIRSLQQKKTREGLGFFVVEGDKMVAEVLESKQHKVHLLCLTPESAISSQQVQLSVATVSSDELKSISSLMNPNKSLAVVHLPQKKQVESPFRIALDGIQDPGNMGTILRLADWFGVEEIICSRDTVDIYNSKVVQASMGAIFRINVRYCDLQEYLQNTDQKVYGALLTGENLYEKPLIPSGILVLGNEGNGISEKIMETITDPITIPRLGKAESLNVSTAAGILLSEFFRSSF
jgi:RNA methyltransferase, TrmH family